MYRPCRWFVSKGSGIIWPLLPQLTFLRQREPASCLRRRSLKHGGLDVPYSEGKEPQRNAVKHLHLCPEREK